MPQTSAFSRRAQSILTLPVAHRVNRLGGYGPSGEVVYEQHPPSCPSVLVDRQGAATATFQTNGSLDFKVETPQGSDVHVLESSFDPVEKRETGVLAANIWLALANGRNASLINPAANQNLAPAWIKIVKIGDPQRALWYCAGFDHGLQTAVCCRLISAPHGPALAREVYLKNTGATAMQGQLWTYFNLHGTQRFVYHKQLWYDAALPLSPTETVNVATVPHEDILQIKRVSTCTENLRAEAATCDYASFIGDSGSFSLLPAAVSRGKLIESGAGAKLNRFATASISASGFSFDLQPGHSAQLIQSLLYVTDEDIQRRFAEISACGETSYLEISQALQRAAEFLVANTTGAKTLLIEEPISAITAATPFEITLPAEPASAAYLNSAWLGVEELYANCRAHGAVLADGIELGTRDRAQDMFAQLKSDPVQVRRDLLHALGFMYFTTTDFPTDHRPLTLPQKMHGMFPRQYPSRWLDRSRAVKNDNRPYADSPLWLIDALVMYLRETGDIHILLEEVTTIRLIDPVHPETSGIIGHDLRLKVIDVIREVIAAYQRHVADSPYGLAQILFGDWCDPVDMLGTSEVGNAATRGQGRGAQIRLTAQVFVSLVALIDLVEVPTIADRVGRPDLTDWKAFANRLRQAVVQWGWEDGPAAGFVDCLHELNSDSTVPNYAQRESGYRLGSMRGDFDHVQRRVLTAQAFGLELLRLERDYLQPIPDRDTKLNDLLATVDDLFYREKLGLMLLSTPIANTRPALNLIGRMGLVPPGCAENGEYHHAQMFMHRFRLNVPGQADVVWEQFKPVLSVTHAENIGGPFDMTSNSFVSDPADPHFGQGMYFGLSGSIDWMIEIVQKIVGVELNLHDSRQPDLQIQPMLPAALNGELTFKRLIFQAQADGNFRSIPLTVKVRPAGEESARGVWINNRVAEAACVWQLDDYQQVEVEIVA